MKAIQALYEAHKIAFSPFVFQTVNCMYAFNVFEELFATKDGVSLKKLAQKTSVSEYGIAVLIEMAEQAEIVTQKEQGLYSLTDVGYFLARDEMTRVNFNFTNDVCYNGLFNLKEAIRDGKPAGLKVFGDWSTVYEGLSQLPEDVKKAWFEFDHYYSDNSFDDALKIIFKSNPASIFDIGGNTGKWAIASTKYNQDVQVDMFDLPGQLAVAKKNIDAITDIKDRVHYNEIDILNPSTEIKGGADVYWMSQFLDCFSENEIEMILLKIKKNAKKDATIYIMETFIDNQTYPAAAFSLVATSLYFTAIANGNSKMYSSSVFKYILDKAGFECVNEYHLHKDSFHTILEVKIK